MNFDRLSEDLHTGFGFMSDVGRNTITHKNNINTHLRQIKNKHETFFFGNS